MFSVNRYFDDQVASIAFSAQGEQAATVGVMAPGSYEFGTQQHETMTVVSGALTVLLPGNSAWQTFTAGEHFEIDADQRFQVKVDVDTAYLCLYR